MTTATTLNFEEALIRLIAVQDLTPAIVAGLKLKPNAVAKYHKLPDETKAGMVSALIDRFSQELGGSWVG